MRIPTFPTITVLLYRPSKVVVSLGNITFYEESDFSFFSFSWAERPQIEAKLVERLAADLRRSREEAQAPMHMVVTLADGRLPDGDLKHDLDSMLAQCCSKALELVNEETRLATMARLQAERERLAKDAAFQKDRDFQALKTLLGKYTMDELRAAGVIQDE